MKKNDNMDSKGIIGFSDDGCPIILPDGVCDFFEPLTDISYNLKECWYCKYADFRKTTDVFIEQSLCRNPQKKKIE